MGFFSVIAKTTLSLAVIGSTGYVIYYLIEYFDQAYNVRVESLMEFLISKPNSMIPSFKMEAKTWDEHAKRFCSTVPKLTPTCEHEQSHPYPDMGHYSTFETIKGYLRIRPFTNWLSHYTYNGLKCTECFGSEPFGLHPEFVDWVCSSECKIDKNREEYLSLVKDWNAFIDRYPVGEYTLFYIDTPALRQANEHAVKLDGKMIAIISSAVGTPLALNDYKRNLVGSFVYPGALFPGHAAENARFLALATAKSGYIFSFADNHQGPYSVPMLKEVSSQFPQFAIYSDVPGKLDPLLCSAIVVHSGRIEDMLLLEKIYLSSFAYTATTSVLLDSDKLLSVLTKPRIPFVFHTPWKDRHATPLKWSFTTLDASGVALTPVRVKYTRTGVQHGLLTLFNATKQDSAILFKANTIIKVEMEEDDYILPDNIKPCPNGSPHIIDDQNRPTGVYNNLWLEHPSSVYKSTLWSEGYRCIMCNDDMHQYQTPELVDEIFNDDVSIHPLVKELDKMMKHQAIRFKGQKVVVTGGCAPSYIPKLDKIPGWVEHTIIFSDGTLDPSMIPHYNRWKVTILDVKVEHPMVLAVLRLVGCALLARYGVQAASVQSCYTYFPTEPRPYWKNGQIYTTFFNVIGLSVGGNTTFMPYSTLPDKVLSQAIRLGRYYGTDENMMAGSVIYEVALDGFIIPACQRWSGESRGKTNIYSVLGRPFPCIYTVPTILNMDAAVTSLKIKNGQTAVPGQHLITKAVMMGPEGAGKSYFLTNLLSYYQGVESDYKANIQGVSSIVKYMMNNIVELMEIHGGYRDPSARESNARTVERNADAILEGFIGQVIYFLPPVSGDVKPHIERALLLTGRFQDKVFMVQTNRDYDIYRTNLDISFHRYLFSSEEFRPHEIISWANITMLSKGKEVLQIYGKDEYLENQVNALPKGEDLSRAIIRQIDLKMAELQANLTGHLTLAVGDQVNKLMSERLTSSSDGSIIASSSSTETAVSRQLQKAITNTPMEEDELFSLLKSNITITETNFSALETTLNKVFSKISASLAKMDVEGTIGSLTYPQVEGPVQLKLQRYVPGLSELPIAQLTYATQHDELREGYATVSTVEGSHKIGISSKDLVDYTPYTDITHNLSAILVLSHRAIHRAIIYTEDADDYPADYMDLTEPEGTTILSLKFVNTDDSKHVLLSDMMKGKIWVNFFKQVLVSYQVDRPKGQIEIIYPKVDDGVSLWEIYVDDTISGLTLV